MDIKDIKYEDILNKDMLPITVSLFGTSAATAANYGVFFIAQRPYEVMEISEAHTTAGSSADAALNIERLQGTEALDAGDAICVAAFELDGTADTVVTKKSTALQNRVLSIGDRLALDDAGTLTNVAGVTVSILLKPFKGDYR